MEDAVRGYPYLEQRVPTRSEMLRSRSAPPPVELTDTLLLTIEDADGRAVPIGIYGGGYMSEDLTNRGKYIISLRVAGASHDTDDSTYQTLSGATVGTKVIGTVEDWLDEEFDSDPDVDGDVGILISGTTSTGRAFALETATAGSAADLCGLGYPVPVEVAVRLCEGQTPVLSALLDRESSVVTGILLSAPIGNGAHWIRRGRQWVKIRDIGTFLEGIEETTYVLTKIPDGAVEHFDQAQDGGGVPMLSNLLVPHLSGGWEEEEG